jgi:hypothetical protein
MFVILALSNDNFLCLLCLALPTHSKQTTKQKSWNPTTRLSRSCHTVHAHTMVSKRQGADLSESETENSPPKRLRRNRPTESDDDDDEIPALTQTQTSNGEIDGGRVIEENSDDSDIEIAVDDATEMGAIGETEEELEEKIRQKHLAKIRAEFQHNIKMSGVSVTVKGIELILNCILSELGP